MVSGVFGHFLWLRGHCGHFFNLYGYFGIIQVIERFSTSFKHGGYFCHFLAFRRYFGHFDVLGVVRSFFIFRGCISLFLGVGCVLEIFCLSEAFWSFISLIGVFWSYSSSRGHFGMF